MYIHRITRKHCLNTSNYIILVNSIYCIYHKCIIFDGFKGALNQNHTSGSKHYIIQINKNYNTTILHSIARSLHKNFPGLQQVILWYSYVCMYALPVKITFYIISEAVKSYNTCLYGFLHRAPSNLMVFTLILSSTKYMWTDMFDSCKQ